MGCDFKPGDELEAVKVCDEDPYNTGLPALRRGRVYVCERVFDSFIDCTECPSTLAVVLQGFPRGGGYCPCALRKVQRRDLTAWLATENTMEGPVRPKVDA